jgi:hypothetical protein
MKVGWNETKKGCSNKKNIFEQPPNFLSNKVLKVKTKNKKDSPKNILGLGP